LVTVPAGGSYLKYFARDAATALASARLFSPGSCAMKSATLSFVAFALLSAFYRAPLAARSAITVPSPTKRAIGAGLVVMFFSSIPQRARVHRAW